MKASHSPVEEVKRAEASHFFAFLILLATILLILFWRGLSPGHVLFANDGPLGWIQQKSHSMPEWFFGTWEDLNSIGVRGGHAFPDISFTLFYVLGPLLFAKLYVPIALLLLGVAAWYFFQKLGLAPQPRAIAAVAVALNSGFFSAACWGVATHVVTLSAMFFALALLLDSTPKKRWLRTVLAGLAVGMGVTEGADIGAMFSVCVAGFVIYQTWIEPGFRPKNLALGVCQVAVVAVFAGFLAAQAVSTLLATNVTGVAGTQQDNRTKEERWDWATQWSLPKREALALVIPGVFGYRMDTPNGGNYWGAAGRDPQWYAYWDALAKGEKAQPPAGFMRYTGGGNYSGILVFLLAVWAVTQALRKNDSAFSLEARRWIWFWTVVAVISLLLAFGRFAPFYSLLYALPYFSTVRNPAKFLHVYNWAVVILFAYGLNGLWKCYMEETGATVAGLKAWRARVAGFDRRWKFASAAAIGVVALGWLIYSSNRDGLEKYLQEVQFDPGTAKAIAGFSLTQVGIFILLLGAAVVLIRAILDGKFSGPRAKWGAIFMGLFIVLDMARANQPWIISWDYTQKYASNPVIDRLRKKPYENRVAILPEWLSHSVRLPPEFEIINQIYRTEWAQHLFPYYNVQSLDIVQMPRMPEDLMAFETALQPRSQADVVRLIPRRWQLTNTRYLLGAAGFVDLLNGQFDPVERRFRIAEQFQIAPKPGVANPTKLEELTAVMATNGNFALIEFTGALPRAKLYSKWQTVTNDQAALNELASASFVPGQTLLVSDPVPAPSPAVSTNLNPGTVEFASYAPKHITLNVNAAAPSILLLNDRFDPNWKVLVDGKPEKLLRCNFIMRGVYLAQGPHKVEFRFEPPVDTLYVTLAALALGVILSLVLVVWKDPPPAELAEAKTPSAP